MTKLFPRLKPEVKPLILAALRNPAYKQARGRLRTEDDRFCVEGVFCNVHAQQHPDFAKTQLNKLEYALYSSFMPPEVRVWAFEPNRGASESFSRVLNYRNRYCSLIVLNDEYKLTFRQIADLIEAQW